LNLIRQVDVKEKEEAIMKKLIFIFYALFMGVIFSQSPLSADDSSNPMVDEILRDVIEYTEKKADEVVREKTGQPYPKTENKKSDHEDIDSKDYSNFSETEKQLAQLNLQHERKLNLLNEELDRTLAKYTKEFRKDSGKEKKPEKLKGKRSKLQKKVDKAYAKFNKRVEQENAKYEKKKGQILSRQGELEEDKGKKFKKEKSKGKGKNK
jgi:hypothetical protein